MKKLLWKLKNVLESFKEDQQGIGVIEVVLILVDIFTGKAVGFYVYIV